MVFENGELWEFNWKRMLRLAMRRAKIQKMVFFMEGVTSRGNSSSRKSKESGSTIVIVDDTTQDISTLYGST